MPHHTSRIWKANFQLLEGIATGTCRSFPRSALACRRCRSLRLLDADQAFAKRPRGPVTQGRLGAGHNHSLGFELIRGRHDPVGTGDYTTWTIERAPTSGKATANQNTVSVSKMGRSGLTRRIGGESGIRTHGRVSPTHAFQACSFNHSDISPL